MHEINLIRLSTSDHPTNSSSAIVPTQTSHDIVPFVVAPQVGIAIEILSTFKHIWFLPTRKAKAQKPKELVLLPTLK